MSNWYDRYNEKGEMEEDSIYEIKSDQIDRFINDVKSIVKVDREKDYGEAKANFTRIATLWNIYLDGDDLTPQDVAIMMILHKISRLKTSKNHRDSWLDIAGYSCLAGTM